MTKVKQTALPPTGAHWSYGADYMRRISKASAKVLCGLYPAPRMGYETVVAVSPDGFRLRVQNISGAYYLACSSAPVDQWPELFQVEVV